MCHLPVQHTVDWSTESEDKAIGRHCLHSAQLAFVDSAFQESGVALSATNKVRISLW